MIQGIYGIWRFQQENSRTNVYALFTGRTISW